MAAQTSVAISPESDATDSALIRAHLTGDPEAFDALYRRYRPRLMRLCRRLCSRRADAEDLAHDTIVRALGAAKSFDCSQPMWPWLKIIATRLAIDASERRSNQEVPTLLRDGDSDDLVVDDLFAGETELRQVVDSALRRLNPRHEAALRLRFLEDWTPEDAAEFLDISRNAFNQLVHRARARLCEEYEKVAGGAVGAIVLLPLSGLFGRVRDRLARLRARVDAWAGAAQTHVVAGAAMLDASGATAAAAVMAVVAVTAGTVGVTAAAADEGRLSPAAVVVEFAEMTAAGSDETSTARNLAEPAVVEPARRDYLAFQAEPLGPRVAPTTARAAGERTEDEVRREATLTIGVAMYPVDVGASITFACGDGNDPMGDSLCDAVDAVDDSLPRAEGD